MAVCQVIDQLQGGGQERVAVDLAVGLHRAGIPSCVLATRRGGDYAAVLEEAGVPYLAMSREGKGPSSAWVEAGRWLKRHRVRVLQAQSPASMMNALGLRAMTGWRMKVFLHLQMMPPRGSAYRRNTVRWIRASHPFVSRFIVTNDFLARVLVRKCGVAGEKISKLFNPVDFSRFDEASRVGRNGTLRAIMVAQWRPQKDHLCAVRAVRLLSEEGRDVRLQLVGALEDQGLVDAVTSEIASGGLNGLVEVMGRRTDVPALLAKADVGVLCTHFEGLPVSAIEYGAAGLPIVMSKVPGTRELAAGFPGILAVDRASPVQAASALRTIDDDRDAAARAGESLRSALHAVADRDAVVARLTELVAPYV